MADHALAEQVIATIAGAARMAVVGGGDVVRMTSRHDDWLDAWPPIGLRGRDPDEAYGLVTGRMQQALTKLDEQRSVPIVG